MSFVLNKYTGTMDLVNNPDTKVIQVSKDESGIGFISIKDAMDSITDASSSNPYVIKVAPGKYYEDTIDVKRGVSIHGSDHYSTKIYATGSTLFNFGSGSRMLTTMADFSMTATDSDVLINVQNQGSLTLNSIKFRGCQTGLLVNNTGAMVWIRDAVVDGCMTTPIADVIKVTAGYVSIRVFYSVRGSRITNLLTSIGSSSEIDVSNMVSTSFGTDPRVETAFNINDGGLITCMDTILKKNKYCIKIGDTGTGSTFRGRSLQLDPTDYALHNLSTSADINLIAVDIEREKVSSVCAFVASGWDSTSDKFRRAGNVAVGMDGAGSGLQVGEGGSYKFGARTLTWDGSDFVEITNGDDIAFSALTADSCIYFGDDKSYEFYGFSYIMGNTAIDLGTGSVVWEYYDGGTSTWTAFNILSTINGYSNSYNGTCFTGTENEVYSIRFDQDIKSGIKEVSGSNTGNAATDINTITGMWVRCRIVSTIDTSPVFKNIRLKGNYKSIRKNGTESFHGESRSYKNITLAFGDSGSGGASKTLNVSSNISYPYWNNGLNDSTTSQLYFRFVITEDIDLSSGLLIKFLNSTAYTGVANKTAKIKAYITSVKHGDKFDGSNAETSQDCDFIFTANDAANLVHFNTLTNRVDINNLEEDDIIYVMFQRTGGDGADDLTNSVDFANVWIEYRQWQSGKNIKS